MQIKTQNNNTTFNGYYQGFSKTTGALHKYPANPVYSCHYADKKMITAVQKMLNSKKKAKDVSIFVENENGTNVLSIVTTPKNIKKCLPFLFRITEGALPLSIASKDFWQVLNNKNVQFIKYQISRSDVKNMLKNFVYPYSSITPFKANTQDKDFKLSILKFLDAVKDKMPKNNHNIKKLNKIFRPALDK